MVLERPVPDVQEKPRDQGKLRGGDATRRTGRGEKQAGVRPERPGVIDPKGNLMMQEGAIGEGKKRTEKSNRVELKKDLREAQDPNKGAKQTGMLRASRPGRRAQARGGRE